MLHLTADTQILLAAEPVGAAYSQCEDDAIIPIFIHALIYFGAT